MDVHDQVVRSDINRMVSMLREKTIKYRKSTKISPVVFGIYNEIENFDEY